MYSFAMICYELFEGSKPFVQMDAMSAARAASLFDRRPSWGKVNRQALMPAAAGQNPVCVFGVPATASCPSSAIAGRAKYCFQVLLKALITIKM